MKLARRKFLQLAACAATPVVPRLARAETYPSRPIHFVVGFPAGGAGDLIARLVGNALSERLNQTILVENRAGASGNIATEYVIRARPDGYTLLDVTAINAWNASLYENLKFDVLRDLVPIAGMYKGPGVLVVHPSVPVKTLPSSSIISRRIPASSTWDRAASAARSIFTGSCSSGWSAWTCCTCPTAEAAPR